MTCLLTKKLRCQRINCGIARRGWREDGYLPAAAFAEVLLQEWSGERSTLLSGSQSAGQPEPEPEPEAEIVALTLEDAEAMSIVRKRALSSFVLSGSPDQLRDANASNLRWDSRRITFSICCDRWN